ncbi:hypothetical protein SDC9_142269 [bioreactor metagenome]|uniref:NlpC/P60 domain-containing protein n=1 Tax=bioreactor metagenome TaxID=1076179 RepID=A0A645E167_9ZZZZ
MRSYFNRTSCSQVYILIIFVLATILFLGGCQSTIRFSSNHIESADTVLNKSRIKNVSPQKNVTNKSDTSDNSNKIIYSGASFNNYSNRIVSIAQNWIGTPYLYGGNTRAGVDCSGFVKNVYSELGIELPRTSASQYTFATSITNPDVGDLVFFKKQDRIYHVGIYLGNDQIIHASSGKGVIIQTMRGNSLEKNHAGYGRVVKK